MNLTGTRRRTVSVFAMLMLALCMLAYAQDDMMPVDLPVPLPTPPKAIANMDDGELYLYIVDQGSQLMRCVAPLIEREGGGKFAKKMYGLGRYPMLVDKAADVLGSQNAVIRIARAQGDGSAQDISSLMVSLGRFAAERPAITTMRGRLLRAKAVYTTALETARVSDGACVPSLGLVEAIARIPPEA